MTCPHCGGQTIITHHELEQATRKRLCLDCGKVEETVELWAPEHRKLTFREQLWKAMCNNIPKL